MVINECTHSGPLTLKLTVSHKEINEKPGVWYVYVDLGKLKVTLINGIPSYEGSYKITVICLFFHLYAGVVTDRFGRRYTVFGYI